MTRLLSRRAALKGMGVSVALPFLEAMLRDLGFRKIAFRRPDYRFRRGMFHAER